jgi:anti-sigma regulatory factor (Ser/Thr protein kinase)
LAGQPLWLVCPYDTSSLGATDLTRAECTHPFVNEGGTSHRSATYAGDGVTMTLHDEPLPEPPEGAFTLEVTRRALSGVRNGLTGWANEVGMSPERSAEFVVAANEVTMNSVMHGGGRGMLRAWCEQGSAVCEVRDRGHIGDPMVDRTRPNQHAKGGRGLWLANHLCELVQIRSDPSGTVVRLHMRQA